MESGLPSRSSRSERRLVPLAGIEPALLAELDFELSASTSSATGAFGHRPGRPVAKPAEYSGGPIRVNPRGCDYAAPRQEKPCAIPLWRSGPGRRRDTCRRPTVTRGPCREPCVPAALAIAAIAAATLGGRLVFPAGARHPAVPALPRAALCLLSRAPARRARAFAGHARAPRQLLMAALRHPAAGGARQRLARRLSRRRRMEVLAGPDRLQRAAGRFRQGRQSVGAARQGEGDPLRRGAVAFPWPFARRLQCADLAC